MKGKFIVLCLVIFMMGSCARIHKNITSKATYKDPETIGGYWNVTMQTGEYFERVKCLYWGTDDDTAVFQTAEGRLIVQSGACTCIQNK